MNRVWTAAARSLPTTASTRSFAGQRRCFSQSLNAQAVWGFIGLGRMGYPMARNLRAKLPADDTLIVHDINEESTHRFSAEVAEGLSIAKDVREVAERSETIITALPEPGHVESVYGTMLSPSTLLNDGIPQRRLFIDCSTIDPMTSARVADAVYSSDQGYFVDAPMSGGVVGANSGSLTFMIGATDDLVERATSVLSMMGRRVLHLGPQGSGLKGKLANNYLLALNNIATAEAMSMGVQWGLDPKALAHMINTSTGRCWPSEVNNPVPGVVENSPATNEYAGGFGLGLMRKDLKLVLSACQATKVRVELGEAALKLYESAERDPRCKGKDFSVIYKYIGGPV